MPAGFHTFSIGFYVLGSSEEPMQTSLCNSHTFGQRQEMIRKCLEDCVGTIQSRVGQVTAENKSRARGLAGTKLCCFLQFIKRQAGNTSKEIASLSLDSRKKPSQTPRREELPPEKGEMAVQDRDRGRDVLLQDTLQPTGSILPGIALPKVTILVRLLPCLEVIQSYCQFLQVRKAAYMGI